MYRELFNEFQDKKLVKDLVRLLQSTYKGWNKVRSCNILSDRVQLFDFDDCETFFGYYDRSPFNDNRKYLLFHRSKITTRLNPRIYNPIELVLWDYKNDCEIKSWKILAYNWQQGCKPQWIDNNRFIFNNYNSDLNNYYSTIVDIRDLSTRKFDSPSYESCSEYYLTLNFSRLAMYRPDYGYRNKKDIYFDDDQDGIFINKYSENETRKLISIKSLCELNPKDSMSDAKHKVNHIMLSKNNSKFMFMHRWITPKGKKDRLYIYNFIDKSLKCVVDTGMVSHCYWYGDDIIGYMNGMDKKPGFYRVSNTEMELLDDKIQHFGDGHPSILGDEMIFDTYPDSMRLKHLYKFNLRNNELIEIGNFKESLFFENQCRCDLHPRFVAQNLVSIDSTHNGKRCFCLITL